MPPFNGFIHRLLTESGYTYIHFEAEFDDGDPENGPGTWGSPPFDEYSSETHRVVVDEYGWPIYMEARDLAFEAYCKRYDQGA